MFGEPLSHKKTSKREDYILCDKLADQRHRWIIWGVLDVVKHRVDVVELANEVLERRGRELLNDTVLDKFY